MQRIFLILAVLVILGLLATAVSGLPSRQSQESKPSETTAYVVHFTLGLFTTIGVLLVHCLIFTYFLGTGRWVKEVKIAYHLPDEPLPKLTRELKRRTFPPALVAMLVTIAASASGAWVRLEAGQPWIYHALLAGVSLLVNLWAFRIELRDLGINAGIIDQVMREVDRIRSESGLVGNEQALREEA